MTYRPDIDGLRALAVLPVMLFHAKLGVGGGFVGVDIFFVISGYLITGILWRELSQGRCSVLAFYERRVRRIFPALFAMLGCAAVVAVALFLPHHLIEFGKSTVAATVFLSNVYFYRDAGYFTEAAHMKPILHTWSLAVEEQFYVVFPILLVLLWRAGSVARIAALLGALAVLSFLTALATVRQDAEAAFYLPHARAWELLLGAVAAIAAAQGWLARPARHLAAEGAVLAGLAAIVWSVFAFSAETEYPGWSTLAPCLGAAILLLVGAHRDTIVGRVLSVRPVVLIGRMSYSLYLWHWPVLVFAGYVIVDPMSEMQALACLALSFALAFLSWRYVEEPFRRGPRAPSRRGVFVAGAGMSAVAFAAGWLLIATTGLPQRMPPQVDALFNESLYLHDRRDCHLVTPERAQRGDVCRRGSVSATPSFVLAGDSHADAISPAVFAAAQRLGLSGWQYTSSGFRPLPGVDMRGDPRFRADTESFMAFLRQRPEARLVIVTAFWQHQITGASYRHDGGVWTDAGYDGSGMAYNRKSFHDGMAALAKAFPDRLFVLLDDVPSGDALDLRTHARTLMFKGTEKLLGASLPRATYEAERATYVPLLVEIARRFGNVRYEPVFGILCTAVGCPLFHGDRALYRNGDHLSDYGARILISTLEGVFLRNSPPGQPSAVPPQVRNPQ